MVFWKLRQFKAGTQWGVGALIFWKLRQFKAGTQWGVDAQGHVSRVGQNPMYTVCIRYFWQGNYQIYGHIRCIYTVLANFINKQARPQNSHMLICGIIGAILSRYTNNVCQTL
jgi:hypothetical protein